MGSERAFIAVATGIAMLAALPGVAQLRPAAPTKTNLKGAREALAGAQSSLQTVAVPRGSRARGRARPADGPLGIGALSSFELRYPGTDHKIRVVGVENAAPEALFQLADKEPADFFTGSASWLRASYFKQMTEVKAEGGGDFLIALPPGPPDHVPLLAGFVFERRPGTDANIRMIAVQLVDGKLRVALMDDQGPDFRGMAPVVAASFGLSGIPIMGGPIASALTGGVMAQEFATFDGKRLRTFAVRVQIVWAPRSAVLGMDSVSGLSRQADGGALPSPDDKVALRGFRFYFGNSDHHLGAIAVKLKTPRASGAVRQQDNRTQTSGRRSPMSEGPQQAAGGDPVKFQDNGTDDPIAWSVDYAKMR